jgi:chromosome condensin MukBEF complex kleisin-like MukF subunit
MSTDTDCVKAELRDIVSRTWEHQKLINRVMAQRLERSQETIDDSRWILKFITLAEAGQKLDWIQSELSWLEEDGLPTVRKHLVDHAIRTAKAAIANRAPSWV